MPAPASLQAWALSLPSSGSLGDALGFGGEGGPIPLPEVSGAEPLNPQWGGNRDVGSSERQGPSSDPAPPWLPWFLWAAAPLPRATWLWWTASPHCRGSRSSVTPGCMKGLVTGAEAAPSVCRCRSCCDWVLTVLGLGGPRGWGEATAPKPPLSCWDGA